MSNKKTVQGPQGRRPAARNPLKALAARNDIQSEYTEIKTGIAEKEMKRIKLESSKLLAFNVGYNFLVYFKVILTQPSAYLI